MKKSQTHPTVSVSSMGNRTGASRKHKWALASSGPRLGVTPSVRLAGPSKPASLQDGDGDATSGSRRRKMPSEEQRRSSCYPMHAQVLSSTFPVLAAAPPPATRGPQPAIARPLGSGSSCCWENHSWSPPTLASKAWLFPLWLEEFGPDSWKMTSKWKQRASSSEPREAGFGGLGVGG